MHKKHVKIKLKIQILLIELTIIFAITLISVLAGSFFAHFEAQQVMEENLKTLVTFTEDRARARIVMLKNYVTLGGARIVDLYLKDSATIEMSNEAAEALCQDCNFLGFTILYRDGILFGFNSDPPDPQEVYIRRAFKGEQVLSSLVYDETISDLVFRIASPLFDGAVLVAAFPGLLFAELYNNLNPRQMGNVTIIDAQGYMITNRNVDYVLNQVNMIREFGEVHSGGAGRRKEGNESMARFFEQMTRTQRGMSFYTLNGERNLAMYDIISGSPNWRIAVSMPDPKITIPVVGSNFIITGAILLALGGIVSFVCAGIIARPFEKIEEQNKMLEIAGRAKSDFFAKMSHEIRTPMNAIIGMSSLMPQDNLSPVQREYFKTVQSQSKTLLQIINDILDVSKMDAGKLNLIPVDYDFFALFDNLSSIMKILAQSKSLEFWSTKAPDVPQFLYGDEIRLRQVYTNILNNAIKYTSIGSVEFTIRVTREEPKSYIVAQVKDTGIGIKPEHLNHLYDSFTRGDELQNRTIIGTGLGLNISKRLVDMMGGSIQVESIYGQGSTFTVLTPLVEGDPAKIKKNEISLVIAKPNARVLVVDDTPVNLMVAKGFLEQHKLAADTAGSGMEALHLLEAKDKEGIHYDIIFMDHMMAGMDGVETTKRIREQEVENRERGTGNGEF